ncbi:MAG TPA: hypothetical protein VHX59_22850 [Mycobacteriales bacterium]|jgi:hypothetical protein|nr:hypothetical protein [Mycobacteriales bacterium]
MPFEELLDLIVSITLEKGGATADLAEGRLLTAEDYWYFPRHPDRTQVVPLEDLGSAVRSYIEANLPVLTGGGVYLGTWVNPGTQECYLDLTARAQERREALLRAWLHSKEGNRRILSIYNPVAGETAYLQ